MPNNQEHKESLCKSCVNCDSLESVEDAFFGIGWGWEKIKTVESHAYCPIVDKKIMDTVEDCEGYKDAYQKKDNE
jgi:hypothetical protein